MSNDNHKKKSGFAVMIGRSNVGKSTLLNSLVGSKIAITTPKPQTTRFPIQGVVNDDRGQIVFVDTPGVFKLAKDTLTKKLLESVKQSLKDVDVVLYVVDPTREIGDEERTVLRMAEELDKPTILVINKTDLHRPKYIDFYRDLSERFDQTIELSARTGAHTGSLKNSIFEYLPEGEPLYEGNQITNLPNEFWLAELIREKLFLRLREEIPYSVHVEVTEVEKRDDLLYIAATIYTAHERYKSMIIGKGGRGIKEVGQSTRKELEMVMETKIYLDLEVEVDPHWVTRFL